MVLAPAQIQLPRRSLLQVQPLPPLQRPAPLRLQAASVASAVSSAPRWALASALVLAVVSALLSLVSAAAWALEFAPGKPVLAPWACQAALLRRRC